MTNIERLREMDRAGKRGYMGVATYHDVGAVVETYIKEHGRGQILFCGRKHDNTPDTEVAQVFASASNALPHLLTIAEKARELRHIQTTRERDEVESAAAGQTFSSADLSAAEAAIDHALTQLDEVEL